MPGSNRGGHRGRAGTLECETPTATTHRGVTRNPPVTSNISPFLIGWLDSMDAVSHTAKACAWLDRALQRLSARVDRDVALLDWRGSVVCAATGSAGQQNMRAPCVYISMNFLKWVVRSAWTVSGRRVSSRMMLLLQYPRIARGLEDAPITEDQRASLESLGSSVRPGSAARGARSWSTRRTRSTPRHPTAG